MLDTFKGNTALEVYVFPRVRKTIGMARPRHARNGMNRSDELGGMLENWLGRDEMKRNVRERLVTYSRARRPPARRCPAGWEMPDMDVE